MIHLRSMCCVSLSQSQCVPKIFKQYWTKSSSSFESWFKNVIKVMKININYHLVIVINDLSLPALHTETDPQMGWMREESRCFAIIFAWYHMKSAFISEWLWVSRTVISYTSDITRDSSNNCGLRWCWSEKYYIKKNA